MKEGNYLYDDWNCVAVLDGAGELNEAYVWGTDLAATVEGSPTGPSQGAGGVGGLLAAWFPNGNGGLTSAFYAYDGNGNVTGLASSSSGSVAAQYGYTPFGQISSRTRVLVETNPYRFSTKPQDAMLRLLDYGFRYYDAANGRWTNRDPIEERGGQNIYSFVYNFPINNLDVLGRDPAFDASLGQTVDMLHGGPDSGPDPPSLEPIRTNREPRMTNGQTTYVLDKTLKRSQSNKAAYITQFEISGYLVRYREHIRTRTVTAHGWYQTFQTKEYVPEFLYYKVKLQYECDTRDASVTFVFRDDSISHSGKTEYATFESPIPHGIAKKAKLNGHLIVPELKASRTNQLRYTMRHKTTPVAAPLSSKIDMELNLVWVSRNKLEILTGAFGYQNSFTKLKLYADEDELARTGVIIPTQICSCTMPAFPNPKKSP